MTLVLLEQKSHLAYCVKPVGHRQWWKAKSKHNQEQGKFFTDSEVSCPGVHTGHVENKSKQTTDNKLPLLRQAKLSRS